MDFESWLKALADGGGSDLYLTTGAPPKTDYHLGSRAILRTS